GEEGIVYATDAYDAAAKSDALLILTEWKEFANLDLPRVRALLKYPIVIDGRNLYEPERVAQAGLIYHSIGRAVALPQDELSDGQLAAVLGYSTTVSPSAVAG